MRKSKGLCKLLRAWIFALIALPLLAQTTTDCPPITQLPNNTGMANNANIHIFLYDNDAGSWSTSTASGSDINQTQTAIDDWTSISGSNQHATVDNYTDQYGDPTTGDGLDDVSLAQRGTEKDPIVVVEKVTPTQAASICVRQDGSSAPACTVPITDSNNVATGAITYVSTDITNGTLPSEYYTDGNSGSLGNFMSHEIGGHDDMGWNDFPAGTANEQNSAMGSGTYTSVGPKPCDVAQAVQCGR